MKKKFLTVFLAFASALCLCFGIAACGETGGGTRAPSEGLQFELNEDGESYTVTGIGTCTDRNIVIPSEYQGHPVTEIGYAALRDCPSLTSVTIPENVTRIGAVAFYNCPSLTSITIPESLTSIGNAAFINSFSLDAVYITNLEAWCGIDFYDKYATPFFTGGHLYVNGEEVTDLHIPNGVTEIKDYAFLGCNALTSITIPESVTSIGWSALGCSSLTSITIPESVTSIEANAFDRCSSLQSVRFEQTEGWKVSMNSDMSDAIDVAVSNPQTAAEYLRYTYYQYYWKRT